MDTILKNDVANLLFRLKKEIDVISALNDDIARIRSSANERKEKIAIGTEDYIAANSAISELGEVRTFIDDALQYMDDAQFILSRLSSDGGHYVHPSETTEDIVSQILGRPLCTAKEF